LADVIAPDDDDVRPPFLSVSGSYKEQCKRRDDTEKVAAAWVKPAEHVASYPLGFSISTTSRET
jgi:hypothetical protein